MNIFEIVEAWIIAGNPSTIQKELADKRASICDNCEFKKEIISGVKFSIICSKCGCPLVKKIYTNNYNSCPLRKWFEIDKPYFSDQKTNKTLF
jgi:hypothetical protein